MNGKTYFIFGSSFLMGMICGGFLYVTVYAPEYSNELDVADVTSEDTTIIIGTMYGGCQETGACASFKLTDDRSYQYQEYPEADAQKGKIPNDLGKKIFNMVGTEAFFTATDSTLNDSCMSYVDGNDFTYEVNFEGEVYTLDTCKTALSGNEQIQSDFLNVWEFMANPTTTYPALIEEGLGGLLKQRLESQ